MLIKVILKKFLMGQNELNTKQFRVYCFDFIKKLRELHTKTLKKCENPGSSLKLKILIHIKFI